MGSATSSITADLGSARRGLLTGSGVVGGLGLVGAGMLAALNAIWFVPLLPVVGGAAFAYALSRSYRPIAERTQLGLERALDYVEGHAIKPSHELPGPRPRPLELLTTEVRKAISSGTIHATDTKATRQMTEIKNVGVLGGGLMGNGIAQVAAAAGYTVTLRDVDDSRWGGPAR